MYLDHEFIAVRITAPIVTKIARLNMRNVPTERNPTNVPQILKHSCMWGMLSFFFFEKTSGPFVMCAF
jgi:hypothetical protein